MPTQISTEQLEYFKADSNVIYIVHKGAGGLMQRVNFTEPVNTKPQIMEALWKVLVDVAYNLRSRFLLAEEIELLLQPANSDAVSAVCKIQSRADEEHLGLALAKLLDKLTSIRTLPIISFRVQITKYADGAPVADYLSITEANIKLMVSLDKLKNKYGSEIITLSEALEPQMALRKNCLIVEFSRK